MVAPSERPRVLLARPDRAHLIGPGPPRPARPARIHPPRRGPRRTITIPALGKDVEERACPRVRTRARRSDGRPRPGAGAPEDDRRDSAETGPASDGSRPRPTGATRRGPPPSDAEAGAARRDAEPAPTPDATSPRPAPRPSPSPARSPLPYAVPIVGPRPRGSAVGAGSRGCCGSPRVRRRWPSRSPGSPWCWAPDDDRTVAVSTRRVSRRPSSPVATWTGVERLQAHLKEPAQGLRRLGHARPRLCRAGPDQGRPVRAIRRPRRPWSARWSCGRTTTRRSPGRAALAAARHDFEDALRVRGPGAGGEPVQRTGAVPPCRRPRRTRPLRRRVEGGRSSPTTAAPASPSSRGTRTCTSCAATCKTARRVLERALSVRRGPRATSRTWPPRSANSPGARASTRPRSTHYARALARRRHLSARAGGPRPRAGRERRRRGGDPRHGAVVARYPLPGPLVALGELYEAAGRQDGKARRPVRTRGRLDGLARANGVNADLDTALAAADHGDQGRRCARPRAEWRAPARPCTRRTPSPGRCTSTAATRRPCRTPAGPPPPATATPRSSTTAA